MAELSDYNNNSKHIINYIVAPGCNPKVVDYCREHNICVVPGVNNPSLPYPI